MSICPDAVLSDLGFYPGAPWEMLTRFNVPFYRFLYALDLWTISTTKMTSFPEYKSTIIRQLPTRYRHNPAKGPLSPLPLDFGLSNTAVWRRKSVICLAVALSCFSKALSCFSALGPSSTVQAKFFYQFFERNSFFPSSP